MSFSILQHCCARSSLSGFRHFQPESARKIHVRPRERSPSAVRKIHVRPHNYPQMPVRSHGILREMFKFSMSCTVVLGRQTPVAPLRPNTCSQCPPDQMTHFGPNDAPWTRWRTLDRMVHLGPVDVLFHCGGHQLRVFGRSDIAGVGLNYVFISL